MKKRIIASLLAVSMTCFMGCGKTNEAVGDTQVSSNVTNVSENEGENNEASQSNSEEELIPYRMLSAGDHSGSYGKANEVSAYDCTQTNYAMEIDASNKVHDISELLYGIFIEDINFAADGGLYAEMVQNRSFEFTSLAAGNEFHAWKEEGEIEAFVETEDLTGALNQNNPNYVVLSNKSGEPAGISNTGFLDGMSIEEGAEYRFQVYAKGLEGYTGPVYASLLVGDEVAASACIEQITDSWEQYEVMMTSTLTDYRNVRLAVTIETGSAAMDMISLFPTDTFMGRENGMRKDLAEKLAELQPAFLRFPGGCVVEGVTLDLAYDWKDSIGVDENRDPLLFADTYGDIAARKMGQNIWTNEKTNSDPYPCFMSYGLGFYEYFQLAEDIGAIGVPVINCGLCCMAQGNGSGTAIGTQEYQQYIQDALDLVEFCRGDENTTWGKVRIAMGHEEPFALKYIGIGNEQWGEKFFKHYEGFVDAFLEAKETNPEMYGDIELMFTSGPDDCDSGAGLYMPAYEYAKNWLNENPSLEITDFTGAVDHHYYNSPDWFYGHNNYYDEDHYSRNVDDMTTSIYGGGMNVFLGEYAAQSNNWNAALAEASYMTGLERNGDIVKMAAYAPLFGNVTATHWAPDLIWFNNHQVTCSVNYYVQKIFAKNAGTTLLDSYLEGAQNPDSMKFKGKVGLGTWSTAAKFDNLTITNHQTGEVLASDDFSSDHFSENWEKVSDGQWSVKDGELVQSSPTTNVGRYGNTGTCAYFGDTQWEDYTITVSATKTAGSEGFLIPFAVTDEKNNYFWNIGGWNNTVSCLQQVSNGVKSDQISGTTKNCTITTNQTYELKIEVNKNNVKCYIDDELYVDYQLGDSTKADCYQVVSTDETGDVIVKLVNVAGEDKTVAISLKGMENVADVAMVDQLCGNSLADDNILGREEVVSMDSFELSGISEQFNYTMPKYSVTVLRFKMK